MNKDTKSFVVFILLSFSSFDAGEETCVTQFDRFAAHNNTAKCL